MSKARSSPATSAFRPGKYISRRVVRAWQLDSPSSYLAPGARSYELMAEGTWMVERIDAGKRRRSNRQPQNEEKGASRWAVASDVFPSKYKRLKENVYLNVESIYVQSVDEHRGDCENLKRYTTAEGRLMLKTREGEQAVNPEDHLIAEGSHGDLWPIGRKSIDSGEYQADTLLNRIALAFGPFRCRHVALRCVGAILAAIAIAGIAVGAIGVASSALNLPSSVGTAVIRTASFLILVLPALARWGTSLAFPKWKSPSLLSLLIMTAGSVLFFAFLASLSAGSSAMGSLLDAFRQFTGGTFEQELVGPIGTFAQVTAFLATLIVFLSFIVVGRIVFRQAWDMAVTRFLSFDLIVLGLGTSTVRLLEDIRSDRTLGDTVKRVVVIERDSGNKYIQRARDLGAYIIFRELDDQLLRRLATSPIRAGWKARYRWRTRFILALTADEATNLRVAEMVDSLRGRGSSAEFVIEGHVAVSVRVDDLWTQERFWSNPITRTDTKTQLSVANSFDSCAEDAFLSAELMHGTGHTGNSEGPVLLVGYSQLAVALLGRLRQEFMLRCALDRAAARKSGMDSVLWRWGSVHWLAEQGGVRTAKTILPGDVEWGDAEPVHAEKFVVHVHDAEQVADCSLAQDLEPSAIMVFGSDAKRRWLSIAAGWDPIGGASASLAFVECGPSDRAEFDLWFGRRSRKDIRGPYPMVTSDGLTNPGNRLHGHIGILGEAMHRYYSLGRENQLWRSEFLSPEHRQSTFRLVEHLLERLDEKEYFPQRISKGEIDRLPEDVVQYVAEKEYIRYYRREKGESRAWSAAEEDEKRRNVESVRFFQDALFTIGLELAKRPSSR